MVLKSKNPNNIQKLNSTLAELKKGKLDRCYLICGEEQYLVKHLSEEVVSAIKKHAKIKDVEVFFGNYQTLIEPDNRGIDSILESLSNIGTLFDTGEKIVWIKMCDHLINPQSITDDSWKDDEKLSRKAKTIKEFPESIANVIENSGLKRNYFVFSAYANPNRNNKLVGKLTEKGCVVEFQSFKEYEAEQVYKYISEEIIKPAKKVINVQTFKLLVEYAGLSLQALINEIKKLIIYTAEKKEITENDIRNLLGITREAAIFDLQDSFGEKASGKFLQNLDSLLQQDIKYPQIVSSLYNRVVMLRQAKELIKLERIDVNQLFRMHYTKSNEFIRNLIARHKDQLDTRVRDNLLKNGIKFIEKIMKQSENFTNEQLDTIVERLLEIDRKTKHSDVSGEAQLQAIFQQLK